LAEAGDLAAAGVVVAWAPHGIEAMNPALAYEFESAPVGDLAVRLPGAAAELRARGVAFCCHPERTLSEAAARKGLEGGAVAAAIAARLADGVAAPDGTAELIDHIVARYHEGHRAAFETLIPLARKVETVHADAPDAPHGLADMLAALCADLEDHMWKEEERLFPMMRQGGGALIAGPIAQMRAEHADQAAPLLALEHRTRGFRPPEGACGSWRALYAGVEALATALVEHMWLENEVLFPRFEGRPAPAWA
jgi:regulator of cell morphogenesis and NO signaling